MVWKNVKAYTCDVSLRKNLTKFACTDKYIYSHTFLDSISVSSMVIATFGFFSLSLNESQKFNTLKENHTDLLRLLAWRCRWHPTFQTVLWITGDQFLFCITNTLLLHPSDCSCQHLNWLLHRRY